MRILPALLALVLAAQAAAQEICPDSTSIVATGGAPHIVLYPDGATYSSHSTESAAHRAAVNLSSRLGVQVLVTRVAAWRVCSPPRLDTTVVAPPPAPDATPAPQPDPEPDPDPTPEPGPVDPDLMTFRHVPAGMSVRTDTRWTTSMPAGWGEVTRRGSITVAADPTSPTGGALQLRFPAGMADGHEAGVAFLAGGEVETAQEMFLGVVMRYSEGWRAHSNQVKLHLWNLADAAGEQLAWFGLFDGCWSGQPGHWTMAVWGRDPIAWPSKTGDCWNNNVRPSFPAHTTGTWVKQEIYARRSTAGQANGIIRVWIDGELVLDAQGLRYPEGFRWREFQHAGTWGGGGAAVPQAQTLYVARTYIAYR